MSLSKNADATQDPGPMSDGSRTTINEHNIFGKSMPSGMVFRVRLPVSAEQGPVPLFAVRNGPYHLPDITMSENYGKAGEFNMFDDATPYNTKYKDTQKPWRVFNGTACTLIGPPPPCILNMYNYRYWNCDFTHVFNTNFQTNARALFQFIPLRRVQPFDERIDDIFSGFQFGSNFITEALNSTALSDGSLAREISIDFNYDYVPQVRDRLMDYMYWDGDDGPEPKTGKPLTFTEMIKENWILVCMRANAEAPTNVEFIDIHHSVYSKRYGVSGPLIANSDSIYPYPPLFVTNFSNTVSSTISYTEVSTVPEAVSVFDRAIEAAVLKRAQKNRMSRSQYDLHTLVGIDRTLSNLDINIDFLKALSETELPENTNE